MVERWDFASCIRVRAYNRKDVKAGVAMNTSLFELFKIGIGPSSSHTVGPMRAALRFVRGLPLERVETVDVELYGSLALTGMGHGTNRAVMLGLMGEAPDTVDTAKVEGMIAEVRASGRLKLEGVREIAFRESENLNFHRAQMYPETDVVTHPNGMRFTARDAAGAVVASEVFYSVGGGFIVSAEEFAAPHASSGGTKRRVVPYVFSNAAELLELAEEKRLTIAEIVMGNEVALLGDASIARPQAGGEGEAAVRASIMKLWDVMQACIERGIATEGTLPGGLNVRRRAPALARRLAATEAVGKTRDPLAPLDSVTLVAMAVNEENAAGGQVVTAPTNGAAGVIPAIAHYYVHHASGEVSEEDRAQGLLRYFLTAAAIGILYKENASISGAEVGCQGEVGVACSMAAGGLVAALGGDNAAVEHAAEIAMEHNLGMTCDPIGGLVQIPCIERNGMGAVKAVNAARLAMNDQGSHKVSLDQVIETMYRTGMDMQSRYKETSLAGLALNVIEC
jgi:L-serine dehydratase